VIEDEISFLGISTVPKNIVIIVGTAVVLGVIGLFLQRTKMGTAMRAVADNRDLAESSGINVERVMLVTWIVGASLAALGGILFGVSETVQWDMGFRLLLLIFAAVVLGGLGTAYGAMVGGFAIGVLVEVSTFWIDVDMKTAVALGALVLMLIVRPQGLLGVKERVA
jgi:branched-chain amino acid transport system permease protein